MSALRERARIWADENSVEPDDGELGYLAGAKAEAVRELEALREAMATEHEDMAETDAYIHARIAALRGEADKDKDKGEERT